MRVELARMIDGEPMLTASAMSLLLGVDTDAIYQHRAKHGPMYLPETWVKQGRRRAGEAKAHTDSEALLDSLRYWAAKDYAVEVLEDAFGSVYYIGGQR